MARNMARNLLRQVVREIGLVGRVWHVKLFELFEPRFCLQQVRHATVCFSVPLYTSGPRVCGTQDALYHFG